MKKYLLAAALVMISTSAMADRTVIGDTKDDLSFKTKFDSCAAAKKDAEYQGENNNEVVRSYSVCDCEKIMTFNDGTLAWRCSVEAKLEKKN